MILKKIGPEGLMCPYPGAIYMFITQPTMYRVIAYFSLYHELVSDRSIVLDITWDYTMAWYPAKKISVTMFRYVMSWPQLRIPGPVHSFGYNMGLYHGLVPSSKDI